MSGWDPVEDGPEEAAPHVLATMAERWGELIGLGPEAEVRGRRHLDVLVAQLTELLEGLDATVARHPSDRVLDGFLAACPRIEGEWELDTLRPELVARTTALALPPAAVGGEGRALFAMVVLGDPSGPHGVLVASEDVDPDGGAMRIDVRLPSLATAVLDHLVAGLRSAAVLVRTPAPGGPAAPGPEADAEDGAADAAEHVVRLLARLEAAVHRAGRLGGDPSATHDERLLRRRDDALGRVGRVRVDVRQRLPEGVLEPTALMLSAAPGRESDEGTVRYHLALDLTDGRRGVGRLEVEGHRGRSVRRVRLPGLVELWLDHVESALRRAHVVTPAVRSAGPEAVRPVPPPVREPAVRELHDPLPDVPF